MSDAPMGEAHVGEPGREVSHAGDACGSSSARDGVGGGISSPRETRNAQGCGYLGSLESYKMDSVDCEAVCVLQSRRE